MAEGYSDVGNDESQEGLCGMWDVGCCMCGVWMRMKKILCWTAKVRRQGKGNERIDDMEPLSLYTELVGADGY